MRARARLSAPLLLIACTIAVMGCGVGEGEPGEAAADKGFSTEVTFPIAVPQLLVTPPEGATDSDVRRLTATLADLDGVAVTEADYTARTVGVVFEDALGPVGQAELAERIAAVPGVARVVQP